MQGMDRTRPAPAKSAAWPVGLLVALCFTTLPLFLVMAPGRPALSDMWRQMGIRVTVSYDDQVDATKGPEHSASPPESGRDVLLGGLLSPDIDQSSCLSRYQSSLYRKPSPHSPSPYLVSRLRKYEALHRKCGPGTLSYNKSLAQLASSAHSLGLVECSYLVWTPSTSHLGDRMLSMASAFLYALLTGRVFLVHVTEDMAGLFCEPFPGVSSWELPTAGFPVMQNLTGLHRGSERSYGNLVGANKTADESLLPSYAYVHLEHDYQLPDQLFFCDDDQAVLAKVNWLILRSDLYFAPGLFLVPQFEDELRWMFPASDTVFHHVGRYLFHPSNKVWELIARYYTSYMSKFEEKIGLQITTVSWNPVSNEEYFKQIAACTSQEKILPEVDPDAPSIGHEAAATSTAVFVSASQPQFAEWLKSMYYEHTTVTGEVVTVLQLSVGKQPQSQKALGEMFLQSYSDVAVVSGWSPQVYVGHGLAGVKPWLLLPPSNGSPCVWTTSMEPCFHSPPNYDCRAKKSGNLGAVLRHVRHCEDVTDGLKLFD